MTEEDSAHLTRINREDPDMVVWWGTSLECGSALARLRRKGAIEAQGEDDALALLNELRRGWNEVVPSDRLLTEAKRLVRVHPLRAADALQLAAAREWTEGDAGETLVSLDDRLRLIARLEGFKVLP